MLWACRLAQLSLSGAALCHLWLITTPWFGPSNMISLCWPSFAGQGDATGKFAERTLRPQLQQRSLLSLKVCAGVRHQRACEHVKNTDFDGRACRRELRSRQSDGMFMPLDHQAAAAVPCAGDRAGESLEAARGGISQASKLRSAVCVSAAGCAVGSHSLWPFASCELAAGAR